MIKYANIKTCKSLLHWFESASNKCGFYTRSNRLNIIIFIVLQSSYNGDKENSCVGKTIAKSEQVHLSNHRKSFFFSSTSTNGTGTGNFGGRGGKTTFMKQPLNLYSIVEKI